MTILQRYVLKEMLGPLALGLFVFTFVFLVGQLFQLTDVLLNSGVSGRIVGELILLLLPGILSITVPMAVLVAILLGMGRLAADREILAIRTSGVSLLHVCLPILVLAASLAGGMIAANQRLIPYLELKSGDLRTQMEFDLLSAIPPDVAFILPGQEKSGATTFFYDSKDANTGDLRGVTIRAQLPAGSGASASAAKPTPVSDKKRKKPSGKMPAAAEVKAPKPSHKVADETSGTKKDRGKDAVADVPAQDVLIISDRGRIIPDIENRVLTFNFTSGSLHVSNPKQPQAYDIIQFDQLTRGYVPTFAKTGNGYYKKSVREMSVPELRSRGSQKTKDNRYFVELYQRFSIPLACIAFALIAIPLGIYVRPTGKAIAFAISFLLILLYYGLLNYGIALGKTHSTLGPFAIFLPNILLASVGSILLYRMVMK